METAYSPDAWVLDDAEKLFPEMLQFANRLRRVTRLRDTCRSSSEVAKYGFTPLSRPLGCCGTASETSVSKCSSHQRTKGARGYSDQPVVMDV